MNINEILWALTGKTADGHQDADNALAALDALLLEMDSQVIQLRHALAKAIASRNQLAERSSAGHSVEQELTKIEKVAWNLQETLEQLEEKTAHTREKAGKLKQEREMVNIIKESAIIAKDFEQILTRVSAIIDSPETLNHD